MTSKTDQLRLVNPDGSLSDIMQLRDIANFLGCKEAAVRYLLGKGQFPKPAAIVGKTMLWSRDQIETLAVRAKKRAADFAADVGTPAPNFPACEERDIKVDRVRVPKMAMRSRTLAGHF